MSPSEQKRFVAVAILCLLFTAVVGGTVGYHHGLADGKNALQETAPVETAQKEMTEKIPQFFPMNPPNMEVVSEWSNKLSPVPFSHANYGDNAKSRYVKIDGRMAVQSVEYQAMSIAFIPPDCGESEGQ